MTLSGVEGALNILALLSTAPHKLGGPGLGQNARCWIKWIGGGKRLQFWVLLGVGGRGFQGAGRGGSLISPRPGPSFLPSYNDLFSRTPFLPRMGFGLFFFGPGRRGGVCLFSCPW